MKDKQVKVWDIIVRLFHWSLVVAFITAYISGEDESAVHIYAGYIVIGLIAFRILWGYIGSTHARFKDFIYGPGEVKDYLHSLLARKPKHYLGHNPAGGWMVLMLLVSLLITGYTGLEVYGAEGYGPLASSESVVAIAAGSMDDHERHESDAEEFWEEVHEVAANFTLFLVLVHVAGVLVSSRLHRENLVKAMINGKKTDRG